MNGKQIEFPPKQTHVKGFEYGMIAICIICVIIVLIIVLATSIGINPVRPSEAWAKARCLPAGVVSAGWRIPQTERPGRTRAHGCRDAADGFARPGVVSSS